MCNILSAWSGVHLCIVILFRYYGTLGFYVHPYFLFENVSSRRALRTVQWFWILFSSRIQLLPGKWKLITELLSVKLKTKCAENRCDWLGLFYQNRSRRIHSCETSVTDTITALKYNERLSLGYLKCSVSTMNTLLFQRTVLIKI